MILDRKVVFIGGADFSGTTMLDLMLGSAEGGFSAGEVYAFFWPTSKHHLNPICSCGLGECAVWDRKFLGGAWEFYHSFFKKNDQVRFVIDSSKSVPWISWQSEILKKQKIQVRHVLIWKKPEDYAKSCAKRDLLKNWTRRWIMYHNAYFCKISQPYVIYLNDLLNDFDQQMAALCNYLDINFQPSMFEYWNTEHHLLFGSATAKLKLHEPGSVTWKIVKRSSYRSDLIDDSQNESYDRPLVVSKTQGGQFLKIVSILKGNGIKKVNINSNFLNIDYYHIWMRLFLRRIYFRICQKLMLKKTLQ
jgi:hypothetical protein